MKTKRSKRWDNGVKARLMAQLVFYDPDFKFEYACRGVNEMLQVYTQQELKQRLFYAQPFTTINKPFKPSKWKFPLGSVTPVVTP